MKAILIACLALCVVACGGNKNPIAPPAPPSMMNIAGTWTGTYSSSQLGSGSVRLVLTRSGGTVGGTWSTVAVSGDAAGTVSGTVGSTGSQDTFAVRLSPSDPRTCPFQVTLTVLVHLDQLLGDWVTVNCTVTANGGMSLRRL